MRERLGATDVGDRDRNARRRRTGREALRPGRARPLHRPRVRLPESDVRTRTGEGTAYALARGYLFGDRAAELAATQEAGWKEWFAELPAAVV